MTFHDQSLFCHARSALRTIANKAHDPAVARVLRQEAARLVQVELYLIDHQEQTA